MKNKDGFNKPFDALKGFSLKKKPSQNKLPKHIKEKSSNVSDEMEIEMFEHSFSGITRLKTNRVEPEPVNIETVLDSIRKSIASEHDLVVQKLTKLVEGKSKFDIRQTGEYVEGSVATLEPSTIEKLKNGTISIQASIDLHGMISDMAKDKVTTFIKNSYSFGYRCILIIHGRGLKSQEGPILKNNILIWLTSGAISRYVLAFCSARPCDGGTGAVYVLLKKRPGRNIIKRTA
jgi:DNA-nicking Smr family endonuclease